MLYSYQFQRRFFKLDFQKHVSHMKTHLPGQRLCQPDRPYRLIINEQTNQKIYYLSYLALYLKNRKTGILTYSLHGSYTNIREQRTYTIEGIPGRLQRPNLTHNIHAIKYLPFSWNPLTNATDHCLKRNKTRLKKWYR